MTCPGCGASYPYRPALSGRKVRCRCGVAFDAVPAQAIPVSEPAESRVLPLSDDEAPPVRRKHSISTAVVPSGSLEIPDPTPERSTPGLNPVAVDRLLEAYPSRRRSTVPAAEEPDDSSKKLTAILTVVMVIVLGLGVFYAVGKKTGLLTATNFKGDDEKIVGMIKSDGATEVKEWVKTKPRHMTLHKTDGQLIGLADQLYSMGAVKVLAFGETISASVAVEMPSDPAKRAALLAFEQKYHGRKAATADVGQSYFLLNLL